MMKWLGIILLMLSAFCMYLVFFSNMGDVYGSVNSVPIMLGIFFFAGGLSLLLAEWDINEHHHH